MWLLVTLLITSMVLLAICVKKFFKKKLSLKDKHVLITGGSKGIGKSMAIYALNSGAHVTIIARDEDLLEATKLELLKMISTPSHQKVMSISVDVTSDYYSIEKAVSDAEAELGPVFMLINCAGTSIAARFDETPLKEFKRMVDINLMGSIMFTRAVLPTLKSQKEGVILFVSSISGLIGLYGYSAYSASKFAVVGLAEVLHMELKAYNIKVCVSFPPDTDTPGFEEEEKTKPKETRLLSESGGLFSPDIVASSAINDALDGKFGSTVGMESLMVKTVCSGMMPVASVFELLWQFFTMPLFRIISVIFLNSCQKIIEKCKKEKEQQEQLSLESEKDE